MEKKYETGKIYEVTSMYGRYIGSTTHTLAHRLCQHKLSLQRFLDGKIRNITVHDVVKDPNCVINLIEDYPCLSKKELLIREKYWISITECVNKCTPIRVEGDKKKYHQDYHQKKKSDPEYIAKRKAQAKKPEQIVHRRDYQRNRRQTDPEYAAKRRESYDKWFAANKDERNRRRRERRAELKLARLESRDT